MSKPIPEQALAQHTAILGKTGSGKTSTAKLAVEQAVADGARVCILDPIKSDWWGLTSSADGKRPGLAFDILGGPHGHLPLPSSSGRAIGELVASGALPRSIIDMADFEPGGLQRFFVDFASALLRGMRGVVYLVIEEAHEFAPKERSGIGVENMAIHWAKKLATAGRSKGIRLILATQRTQSLHNALLGSCETMIVHRMTAPADQGPVEAWLKANAPRDVWQKVAGSLSSLKTGTGWICSGEAGLFELRQFPRIGTYDNSATPTHDGSRRDVKKAPVDQDRLRTIIGEAVQEAEANDPAKLKQEIARLKKAMDAAGRPTPGATAVATAGAEDLQRRISEGERERDQLRSNNDALRGAFDGFAVRLEALAAVMREAKPVAVPDPPPRRPGVGIPPSVRAKLARPAAEPPPAAAADVPGPGRRILNSLATWSAMGHASPSNAQVAWLAGYSPSSTSYTNPRGALRSGGLIDYPSPDHLALTPAGASAAVAQAIEGTLLDHVLRQLPGPEARILKGVAHYHPESCSNAEAAAYSNYSASSTSYTNPRGALKTKELITYPSPGQVRAADWLFEGRR